MTRKRTQGRDAGGDPMIPLIRRARQQIAARPGGPLGWLVEFVREDADTWLPGDVEAHGHRLLALVYAPMSDNVVALGRGRISPLTPTSIVETHAELRAFVRALVTVQAGTEIEVPTEGLKEMLVRTQAPGVKPASWGIGRGGPRRTLLYQTVKALVAGQDRLIACPECGKPFLALRKKKFCDTPCLQAWWDAKRSRKGSGR